MTSTQHEIRQDIERTRNALASKTSELSHRATEARNKLRLSHYIDERPFTMFALSLVAGFAVEKVFFESREKLVVVNEDERPRKKRRKLRRKLEEMGRDGEDEERGAAMRSIMALGQSAAGALAREVAGRLLHRQNEPRRAREAMDEPQRPRA